MRQILLILLQIFLIGCESEQKSAGGAADVKDVGGEVEKGEVVGEAKRKAIVQDLVRQMSRAALEENESIFTDLRDVYARKRDIPDFENEINRSESHEVKDRLKSLISFMHGRWRLPNNTWTNDVNLCEKTYEEEFKKLSCFSVLTVPPGYPPKPDLMLDILDYPIDEKNRADIIDLIYTLEPEALMLPAEWKNIGFAEILTNLKKFEVGEKVIINFHGQ